MIKQLLAPLLIFTSLHAVGIDPEELNSIYIEAALFVTVFGLMSVVSFIISRKHAEQNALKNLQKKELQKEAKKSSQTVSSKQSEDSSSETKRVKELSKMLKDGLITDKEFQTLKGASK
jgi:mannitol-specific phosphotransferase system IIBC component